MIDIGRFKKTGLCLIVACLLIGLSACEFGSSKKVKIHLAVQEELRRYPKATLIDLYKFFFQGAFGPGHLVKDRHAAQRFLQIELEQASHFSEVTWQPVGYTDDFYRLGLGLIRDGVIPQKQYLDAFLQSAADFTPPAADAWRAEWRRIIAVISEMALPIEQFRDDSLRLEQHLEAGLFAIHHSETFKKLYHPHYRVVDRERFEQLYPRYLREQTQQTRE